jgi:hypothetical protein
MRTALIYLGALVAILFLYAAVNTIGQSFEPKIRAYDTEDAHCYTANKMFFVSIACVPKRED